MNSTLIKAVVVVTLALVCYSIAVLTEQKQKFISNRVLTFLTAGIVLDISSTVLMIIGSRNIPITAHGFLGYSALIVMLIETILLWRYWSKNGGNKVSKGLNIYTRIAYSWWVIAYIAGAIIAMTMSS